LLISVPLGYFGGIGLASRNGILFKGADYLDNLRKADTLLFDKTGTLTSGKPVVEMLQCPPEREKEIRRLFGALEKNSTHPLGKAITEFCGHENGIPQSRVEESTALGISGVIEEKHCLAGSRKFLDLHNIHIPEQDTTTDHGSRVFFSIDGIYLGYFSFHDPLKPGIRELVSNLRNDGFSSIAILSGDKKSAVEQAASQSGITEFYSELMPEQKYLLAEQKMLAKKFVLFAGDGINDAPVIAKSHIGIAMGAMGSAAAIETADMVIHNDDLGKILTARKISRATHSVVIQNVILAFGVKLAVLALGAGGIATLWEAVFADVGVALLAVANSARLPTMKIT
jgi:Cd2+/Zn2+-exporting ATPase